MYFKRLLIFPPKPNMNCFNRPLLKMFFKQKILNQRNIILQKSLHNQAVAITASLVSFLFSSSWFCSQAFTTFKMTDMKTVGSIMFNLRQEDICRGQLRSYLSRVFLQWLHAMGLQIYRNSGEYNVDPTNTSE